MKHHPLLLFPLLFTLTLHAQKQPQKQVLDSNMHHLRKGIQQEWSTFPIHADASRLIIDFNVEDTISPTTLSLRQYDVNQTWKVTLNNTSIGTLAADEKDMFSYFEIPPATLKQENTLEIEAEIRNDALDDIIVGEITLERRPLSRILDEASVKLEVTNDKHKSIPSRITIVNKQGVLQQVATTENLAAFRTGYIYSGDGNFSFTIPAGSYRIYATRGFEYGVDSIDIDVKPKDKVRKKLTIAHEVTTDGWVNSDTHIHTLTHSGHGDATVSERIISIAGEGIDLPVMTDHNVSIDISRTVKKMRLGTWFTPIVGNEVTTAVGHFNIFPVSPTQKVPNSEVKSWNELNDELKKQDNTKVVILNHARDIHRGFRPFDPASHISIAGKSLYGWNLPANAMEVLNSGSQQTDPRELYRDWMALMNRGIFLTPIGSSDSHDVSRFIVGQARTYIKSKKDIAEAMEKLVAGNVSVSFGLFTEILVNGTAGPGDLLSGTDELSVSIKVWAPSWATANKLMLFANGLKVHESAIPKNIKGGIKWEEEIRIPKPSHDVNLVAVAEGPGTYLPFWPIARPFQHSSPELDPILLGLTGAVKIDAENDGKFTSAYEYARQAWDSVNGDVSLFLTRLNNYGEEVVVQGASILTENKIDVNSPEVTDAIAKSSNKVKIGFDKFLEQYKLTLEN